MKKSIAIIITLIMIIGAFPVAGLAANATISTNGDYGLAVNGHTSGDTITIAAGCTVNLIGNSHNIYTNFRIVCGSGVHLTLQDVIIDDSANADTCPLSFTGNGNTLTLSGGNWLTGGTNEPAVRAEDTAEVEIKGSGTLNATGGANAAAVGGGLESDGGSVTISGGTVNATGGALAAGIGSGYEGDGGAITISGGTVTATGGTIYVAGSSGAGIGTGCLGSGGTIRISGGTVNATGGTSAVGIGGGESGGNVDISGGIVYAARNGIASYDIGSGDGSGTISISGTASVFLRNDSCTAAATTTHMHMSLTRDTGSSVYGVPCNWTGSFGAYMPPPDTINIAGAYTFCDSNSTSLLVIVSGLDVTLKGGGTELTYLSISCGAGVHLTLQDVNIDDSAHYNCCPLTFTGSGNTLTLSGTSTLIGGENEPAVSVEDTAEVEISGSGTLNAAGGSGAAGIGGSESGDSGTISISGGTVNATGDSGGAGIGGGDIGNGGDIDISGGTVQAMGGSGAAGIGSGCGVNFAPTSSGNINISGGTVTAMGGHIAAGIGGGYYGSCETVTITGGIVLATAGADSEYDIGYGYGGSGGTLSISGIAAVLLRNNGCIAPTTTHTHESIADADGVSIYGIPCSWTGNFGAYLRLCTLNYNENGGSGITPGSVTQHISTTCIAAQGTLSRTGYLFDGWNTAANGSGTTYQPGDTVAISGNITLFAKWRNINIDAGGTYTFSEAYSHNTISINTSQPVTLQGGGVKLVDFQIVCAAGVQLTLQDVKIDNSGYADKCPVSFTGGGNTLTLSGASTLTGGAGKPAVYLYNATEHGLEMKGGGTLFAGGGSGASDIGANTISSDDLLVISGTPAVFLRNDSCVSTTTASHTHESISNADGVSVYGMPCSWTGDFGAYLRLLTISYQNGILVYPVRQQISTTCNVAENMFSQTGFDFTSWNTAANGSGTAYQPGDTFTLSGNITLHALWELLPVSTGGTYTLDSSYSGYTLNINTTQPVTLQGGGITLTDFQIACTAGAKLTLYNVNINDNDNNDTCPLSFTGSGNTLTLSGASTLKGGGNESAIKVEDSTELEIEGSGMLSAVGGVKGAGIGGGMRGFGGAIIISGGEIDAVGNSGGAGIGGGYYGNGGTIAISGGTIQAMGGSGAGIGGGYYGNGGTIVISGGTVQAMGGYGGAGIGSGQGDLTNRTNSGNINISGGTVTAMGGYYSAGIGGGYGGKCETVAITGGVVLAIAGVGSGYDIGYGVSGEGGTLGISGTAAVFLRNDSCVSTTAASHTHKSITDANGESVYGVPCSWMGNFGAYLRLFTLSYDANGGSGTAPDAVTQHIGTTTTVADGGDLTLGGLPVTGWNSKHNGSGTWYAPGSSLSISGDTMLYAIWLGKPGVSTVCPSANSVTVNWDAVAEADGYEVWRGGSEEGAYTKIYTASSGTTLTYTNNALTTGQAYYYKVRAYVTAGADTLYGDYSAAQIAVPRLMAIQSSHYTIDQTAGLIKGVADGTTVAQLKSRLDNDSDLIKVYDADDQEVTEGIVGTGMTVKYSIDGEVKDSLSVVVPGDTSGDGAISISDYVLVRLDILGLKDLSGAWIAAGDVNGDGKRNVTDYTLIRLDILGEQNING